MALVSKRFGAARVGQVQFVTAADVQRLKSDIAGQVTVLDAAFLACLQRPGALDDATQTAWHTMKNRALLYVGESAPILDTAAAMNAGQAIQRDLSPWYDTLAKAGCSAGPKPETSAAPKSLLDSLGFDRIETVALVLGALFVMHEFGGRR